MSDESEADRLHREVRERQERLEVLEIPQTTGEARELARTDPQRFNALFDAGRIPAAVIANRPQEG